MKLQFVEDEQNEASELLIHEKNDVQIKPQKSTTTKDIDDIEIVSKKIFVGDNIVDILSEIPLNKSAMLNLQKFLYSVFTGKSTTNLRKREIKKTNLAVLSKW